MIIIDSLLFMSSFNKMYLNITFRAKWGVQFMFHGENKFVSSWKSGKLSFL